MEKINYEEIYNNIDYLHVQRPNPKTQFKVDFHLHSAYEIFFLISGDVNYFVENKIYPLKSGDIIITNNLEIHKPSIYSDKLYDRITLHINPAIISPFNSQRFDLLNCFTNRRNGEKNKISLNPKQLQDIIGLFNKIDFLVTNPFDGCEILKLTYFIELLIFINRIYSNSTCIVDHVNIPSKLIPILEFIDHNLESDLKLETLEKMFYINRFYLCKLFKNSIGSTIHEYIIYKRISLAKLLLSKGYSVTDTCSKSGFNDYTNFIRMFKRTVGLSPGKYKKTI